jgi:hypothetical protein
VHREGEVEQGTTQRREAQLGQGRGKGAASSARWPSGIDSRMAHALGISGFEAGEGDLVMGWSGPVGALSFGAARQCRDARPRGGASLLAGAEQGRGERREGGKDWNSN